MMKYVLIWSSLLLCMPYSGWTQSFLNSSDTLFFYGEANLSSHTRSFGEGVIVGSYFSNPKGGDSLKIRALNVGFYGGGSVDGPSLSSASIQALLWENPIDIDTLTLENSSRRSSTQDINLSALESRFFRFVFTDTSLFIPPTNYAIGIYYSSSNDSVNAISPIFTSDPIIYPQFYSKGIWVNDTLIAQSPPVEHETYWSNPDQVGAWMAYVEFTGDSTGVLTSIENPSASIPRNLQLNAYPNPFNPSTTLTIQGKVHGSATLYIVDLLGRTLLEEEITLNSGVPYHYKWDANGLSSGIYLVKVVQNLSSISTNVMLVK